jgi:hypothetical protein
MTDASSDCHVPVGRSSTRRARILFDLRVAHFFGGGLILRGRL